MNDLSFDTMATMRRLRACGFEEPQAEAITSAIRDGVTGGVATKADLVHMEKGMKADLVRLENDLKWVKLIGGAILAVLILPWLAELVSSTMPGS